MCISAPMRVRRPIFRQNSNLYISLFSFSFQDGAHNSYGGASGRAGSEVLRGQLHLLSPAAIHNFYHINRSEYFFNYKKGCLNEIYNYVY